MLTLTHTHAEGTMLHGTSRGDGSADVLKARPGGSYWKWSRNLGAWFIVRSRDTLPNRSRIEQTAEALRGAGFDVTTEVDETVRPTAEVVEGQRARAADRVDALDAKAERHGAAATGAWEAEHTILDHIPMGQPILVGHHSERRHRRDLERAHRHMERAAEHHETAQDAARRAEIARLAASGREARSTVENRVKKLCAEVARDLRALHGYWNRWGQVQTWCEETNRPRAFPMDPDSTCGQELAARITENTDARLYWSEVLAAMPTPPKPVKPVKGDTVEVDGQWLPVVRSSQHDVTVQHATEDDPKRTRRVPWGRISGWNRADSGTA